ncbi:Synaptotagmin-4 [Apostasia shenzhenica]|uniref:Synaptotagmin-4 n=1 Tax=Apostasia shenzhenica TaxID=1088818 RepID=A0A2I0AEZ3_9ASPA|nr:Synaptotagmin-4 [Apostasia shenzhenica]
MARKLRNLYAKEAVEFLSRVIEDKPLLPFLVPLGFFAWAIERWLVPFSNWIPLAFAVWATIEYGRYRRQLLIEGINRRWKQLILHTAPVTPLEPCEWLNKLLMEVWPNYMEPKLSTRFSSTVERRLKHRKPKLIEKLELQEFSLGSCPPNLGQNGVHWITSGEQMVMRLGFDWDSNEMSILLLAKLAKPLMGTARFVINSIHIKGELLLTPILDGQAILYSFDSTPEVRIGVAFGSGNGHSLPATELPGVSTWLVKIFTETLNKIMVEPRRACFSLPYVDLRKKAVGGVLSVSIVSANNLHANNFRSKNVDSRLGSAVSNVSFGRQLLQTFIEAELEDLTRKTDIIQGSNPRWNATFNMVLHGDTGTLRFHLYELDPSSVKLNYLTSCEIKMKYVADDSTMFWAIGPKLSVVAKHVENCGKEVQMVIPFEETNFGEVHHFLSKLEPLVEGLASKAKRKIVDWVQQLAKCELWTPNAADFVLKPSLEGPGQGRRDIIQLTVRLAVKEWQYSDGSVSVDKSTSGHSQSFVYGSPNLQLRTGRKLIVTVVEGKDLHTKDKSGKCDPYVKLHYGKGLQRTKTVYDTTTPVWNQTFEFDEIGGEYLKVKCFSAEKFGDENIGTARVNLEGILDGSGRDVWVPLEKVSSGEVRLKIESVKNNSHDGCSNSPPRSFSHGWVELVLIEARDLVAADLRGTSDPYVRVQYGNTKKRTKVIYKTLNPQWNQTLEFPDTGSRLVLHVKDHNALLPESSIGDCVVEYEGLPSNQTADKWIPLQGVRSGEIHVQVTRRIRGILKKPNKTAEISSVSKAHQKSGKMREMLKKIQGLIDDGDLDGLSSALSEAENAEYEQEEYMLLLEKERTLLIDKISDLGREISRTTSAPGIVSH